METRQQQQPVDARLLGRQAASLSAWYADPLSKDAAQTLAAVAHDELRSRLCEGSDCFQLHLLLLVCRFWTGGSIEMEYRQLAASSANDRERALLELVCGQLLICCKCRHALRHLCKGFALAVEYLGTPDYFCLVRQHELLAYLALSSSPAAPLSLDSLLREAGVIQRLQAGSGVHHENSHLDTVG